MRVADDCSGIGTTSYALKELGVQHEYVFASESHRTARKWLTSAHNPHTVYHDVTAREHASAPACDLYVATPPCVGFSGLNQKKMDTSSRSCQAFEHCLRYVESQRPRMVLFENVARLQSRGKTVFDDCIGRLRAAGYAVHWRVLDACNYGVPQSRPRLIIVAFLGDALEFEWPKSVPLDMSCLDLLEEKAAPRAPPPSTRRALERFAIDPTLPGMWDPDRYGFQLRGSGNVGCPVRAGTAPCLVSKQPGLYVNHLQRLLSGREALRLQGFDFDPPIPLSDGQTRRLAGNAVCLPVLTAVLKQMLECEGRAHIK